MVNVMFNTKVISAALMSAVFVVNLAFCAESTKAPEAMKIYNSESTLSVSDYDTLLFHDDGNPQYYFPLPDEWDDHYFNVRFSAPDSCKLISAEFYFTDISGDSSDLPDIKVLVWPSTGLYPEPPAYDEILIEGASISLYPDPTIVDLDLNDTLNFGAGMQFHVGWDIADTAATDTILAMISDDGIPETTFSSEYWGEMGMWGTISANWGLGVNFMIRAQVLIFEDTTSVWLEPDRIPSDFSLEGPYPNPFNPETSLTINLQKPQNISLRAYDLSGRMIEEIAGGFFPAGRHIVSWKPASAASGTYIIKLNAGDQTVTARATLMK